MEPKIDKGIPLSGCRPRQDWLRDVLDKLEVGDSMFFDDNKSAENFRVLIYRAGGRAAKRAEKHGWRVWRIK